MKKKATRGISKKSAFLAAFAETASVTRASKAAKIDRALHYRWMREDAEYPERFKAACEEAAQLLEDEAVRRAHEGVEEPVVYKGSFTYPLVLDPKTKKLVESDKPLAIRKYSDAMLLALLKGFLPEKYRDRVTAEVSGPGGGPIPIAEGPLSTLTDDELAGLIAVAKKLAPAPRDGSGAEAPPEK